ncbi:MAG: hypothetical protein WDM76_11975 [Limisphaerales bacterium]
MGQWFRDGYYFAADGEGGSADTSTTLTDYAAYIGTAAQSVGTGIYAAGVDTTAPRQRQSLLSGGLPDRPHGSRVATGKL